MSSGTELPSLDLRDKCLHFLDSGTKGRFAALLLREAVRSNTLLGLLERGGRLPNPGEVQNPSTGASCSSRYLHSHRVLGRPFHSPGRGAGLLPRGSVGVYLGIESDLIELFERFGVPFCGGCKERGVRTSEEEVVAFHAKAAAGATFLISLPLEEVEFDKLSGMIELFGANRIVVDGEVHRSDELFGGGGVAVVLESVQHGQDALVKAVHSWGEKAESFLIQEVVARRVVRALDFEVNFRCPTCRRRLEARFLPQVPCPECAGGGESECVSCHGSGLSNASPHFILPTGLDTASLFDSSFKDLKAGIEGVKAETRLDAVLPAIFSLGLNWVTLGTPLSFLDYSSRSLLDLVELVSSHPSGEILVFDHLLSLVAPSSRELSTSCLTDLAKNNGVLVIDEPDFASVAKPGGDRPSVTISSGMLACVEEGIADITSLRKLRAELDVARTLYLDLESTRSQVRLGELGELFIALGELLSRSREGRLKGLVPLDLHPRRGRYRCTECNGYGRLTGDWRASERRCARCRSTGLLEELLRVSTPWGISVERLLELPISELLLFFRSEPTVFPPLEGIALVGGADESLTTDLSYFAVPTVQRFTLAAETARACSLGGGVYCLFRGMLAGMSWDHLVLVVDLLRKYSRHGHTVMLVEGDVGRLERAGVSVCSASLEGGGH